MRSQGREASSGSPTVSWTLWPGRGGCSSWFRDSWVVREEHSRRTFPPVGADGNATQRTTSRPMTVPSLVRLAALPVAHGWGSVSRLFRVRGRSGKPVGARAPRSAGWPRHPGAGRTPRIFPLRTRPGRREGMSRPPTPAARRRTGARPDRDCPLGTGGGATSTSSV